MALKLSNNASSTLAAAITAVATTLTVQPGDASKFPTLAPGDWFPVTVVDVSSNMEIMRCTARAGNVLTVTRAQEGSVALAFAGGSRLDVRLTAKALEDAFALPGVATPTTDGLMAKADKAKLDDIEPGAEANPGVATSGADGLMAKADKAKLDGIASGATANATDAQLRARSSQTGTQDISSTTTGTLPLARGGTGQTTEAGMRGVYTGTSAANTAFPISSMVSCTITSTMAPERNATVAIRLNTTLVGEYSTSGAGALLAGTWRARGGFQYVTGASAFNAQRAA